MMRLAVLVMVALTGGVLADVPVPQVEQITAGERDKVQVIFDQQQRSLMETCVAAKIIKASALSVAEPLTVGADKKLFAGRWRVRYAVDACGKAALRTAEFRVDKGAIAIEPLIPGETLTDAALQADVAHSFAMAGYVAMPQCTDTPVVRDTKIWVYPAKPKDRWQEVWVGSMCGRDLGQVVDFLPTKTGTTFKMSLPVKPAANAANAANTAAKK